MRDLLRQLRPDSSRRLAKGFECEPVDEPGDDAATECGRVQRFRDRRTK